MSRQTPATSTARYFTQRTVKGSQGAENNIDVTATVGGSVDKQTDQ